MRPDIFFLFGRCQGRCRPDRPRAGNVAASTYLHTHPRDTPGHRTQSGTGEQGAGALRKTRTTATISQPVRRALLPPRSDRQLPEPAPGGGCHRVRCAAAVPVGPGQPHSDRTEPPGSTNASGNNRNQSQTTSQGRVGVLTRLLLPSAAPHCRFLAEHRGGFPRRQDQTARSLSPTQWWPHCTRQAWRRMSRPQSNGCWTPSSRSRRCSRTSLRCWTSTTPIESLPSKAATRAQRLSVRHRGRPMLGADPPSTLWRARNGDASTNASIAFCTSTVLTEFARIRGHMRRFTFAHLLYHASRR